MIDVKYQVSINPSKFMAYYTINKKKGIGTNKMFLNSFYNSYLIQHDEYNEEKFVDSITAKIICFTLLERICLERAYNKCKIKNRCKPFSLNGNEYSCKSMFITDKIIDILIEQIHGW